MDVVNKKKIVGRPTDYTPELATLICERVATHEVGLKQLCSMYDDMPDKTTINRWRYKHPEFCTQYAHSKISRIEMLIDEIQELCDVPTYEDAEGVTRVDSGLVARQRLKVDTLKWQAAKLVPRLYGKDERINIEFPDITDSSSLIKMSSSVFQALVNQDIGTEQARTLIGAIKRSWIKYCYM